MIETFDVNKTENLIPMSTYHLTDTRLSIEAKGLLTLLLSMPDDWEYSIENLKSIMREDENVIQDIINELTAAGYFKAEPIKDTKGVPYRTEYFIFEKAQTEGTE